MPLNKYTQTLFTILTAAVLLNGLNPWINPNPALAVENPSIDTKNTSSNCFSNNKVASQTLEKVSNVERLLGYLESTTNDVKSTVVGIDRKMSEKFYARTRDKK